MKIAWLLLLSALVVAATSCSPKTHTLHLSERGSARPPSPSVTGRASARSTTPGARGMSPTPAASGSDSSGASSTSQKTGTSNTAAPGGHASAGSHYSYETVMNESKAANGSDDQDVVCPRGWLAVGGGLQTQASSSKPYVIDSEPEFWDANGTLERIASKPDGTYGPPAAWYAQVSQRNSMLKAVVVCTSATDVKTVIASRNIQAGPSTGALDVSCPSGYIASGGGAGIYKAAPVPYLETSAPVLPGATKIDHEADGVQVAPTGWRAAFYNVSGNPAVTLKAAAICARISDVRTFILTTTVRGNSTTANTSVGCPSGTTGTSGGIQSAEQSNPPFVLGISPVFGSTQTNGAQPLQPYPGPSAWFFEFKSASDSTFKVAAVCAPA